MHNFSRNVVIITTFFHNSSNFDRGAAGKSPTVAAITQHIPDKSFQLVRYYGWYSNKMRGQRKKRAEEEEKKAGEVDEKIGVIDVSEHHHRRIPSKKWRELIKKVWEANAPGNTCPCCGRFPSKTSKLP